METRCRRSKRPSQRRQISGRFAFLAFLVFGLSASVSVRAGTFTSLNTAADYSVLQFNASGSGQTQLSISGGSTDVNGPLGSAENTNVNFSGVAPSGPLYQSSVNTGGNNYNGATPVTGPSVASALAQAVSDAQTASANNAVLTATQTINSVIVGGETITGNGGLNVVDLTKGVNMTSGSVLTISGDANDVFVINVDSQFVSNNGASVVLNGVMANQILWNYLGSLAATFTGGNLSNTWEGTVLAPYAQISAQDRTFNGALIAGDSISMTSNPVLNFQAFRVPMTAAPEPASVATALLGGGLVFGGVGLRKLRRR